MLVVNDQLTLRLDEFEFSYARSSGPGGQNVNKVNTKVTMHWPLKESTALPAPVRERLVARCRRRINKEGQLVISSQRYRDQARNQSDCLDKLRELILEVWETPPTRRATRPTQGSRRRRLENKRQASEKKRLRRPPERD